MRPLVRMLGPAVGYRRDDRRLLAFMYLAGLVQGFAQTQAVNTLPFVRLTFDLSEGDMSYLFALARIGSLVAVVYAVFGDRLGRRGPFLTAYLILISATSATALSAFPSMYTALQMIARMGSAAAAMLVTVLIAEKVQWNNRAWAISLYSTAVALGSGAGLLALPIAQATEMGWRLLFGASVIGLPVYWWMRGRVEESRIFRFPAHNQGVFTPLAGPGAGRFWAAGVYSLSISAFSAVALTFALERLVNGLGFTSFGAARIMLIGGTLGSVGFFLGGRIGDTLGRRPAILMALAIGLIGGIGFYWSTSQPMLILTAALSALGSSAAAPVSAAQRTELFPTEIRATATQWLHTVAVIGSISGLTIAGTTIDTWGLTVTVTAMGIGVLVGGLAQLTIPETLGHNLRQRTTRR